MWLEFETSVESTDEGVHGEAKQSFTRCPLDSKLINKEYEEDRDIVRLPSLVTLYNKSSQNQNEFVYLSV